MIHPESTCAFHVKCTCAMVCRQQTSYSFGTRPVEHELEGLEV